MPKELELKKKYKSLSELAKNVEDQGYRVTLFDKETEELVIVPLPNDGFEYYFKITIFEDDGSIYVDDEEDID